jgi:hypothetical protein
MPRPGHYSQAPSAPLAIVSSEAIASRGRDLHLRAIARAIGARLHLLHTMQSIDALAEFVIGDLVGINHQARPRYLQGLRGTIIDVDAQAATISLERPIGRFTSGELRCPPLAVDRLDPASADKASPGWRDCLHAVRRDCSGAMRTTRLA